MGANPQPPRAPAPPPLPRSSSNTVAIALLILALIIAVCGVTLYTGARFLARNVQVDVAQDRAGEKQISIKTPAGDFEVRKNADVGELTLGLPIYPGAQRVTDDYSALVDMGLPGEQHVRVTVGKFQTPDDFNQVVRFYQDRIGSQVTKLTRRDRQGKTVFEIKSKDEEKIVALKDLMSGAQIELVHVLHGQNQTN
jgi:hypothetical protein